MAFVDHREGDRSGASGDQHGQQGELIQAEAAVDQQGQRHGGCDDDGERHRPTTEALANGRRADVDMGAGAQHQHGEAERAERRQWLRRGVDDAKAGGSEHDSRGELTDHPGDQPAWPGAEQRAGQPRQDHDRQLNEHRRR